MTIEECQALSKEELIEVVQEAYAEIDRAHEEMVRVHEELGSVIQGQMREHEKLIGMAEVQTERASAAWIEALQAAVRTLKRMTQPGEPYNPIVERAILALPRAVP